tara:strand:+ start:295 stop:444 length:150 start_codon:yes stop_codon:yes gene_type:complete
MNKVIKILLFNEKCNIFSTLSMVWEHAFSVESFTKQLLKEVIRKLQGDD